MNLYFFIILAILALIPAVYGLAGVFAGKDKKVSFENDHYKIGSLTEKVRACINNRISQVPGHKVEGDIKRKILRAANSQSAPRKTFLYRWVPVMLNDLISQEKLEISFFPFVICV